MHVRHVAFSLLFFGLVALAVLALPPDRARGDEEGGTRLRVDRLTHDFGPVGQEQELETTITYRNEGTEKISDIRAIGDCGCYGVTLTEDELEPGQEGTLTVKFRTLMMHGTYTKKLRILSGTGTYDPLTVKLIVKVIGGVIVAPKRIWFGDVLVGQSPSKTIYVKWHSKVGKAFKLLAVEVPGYDFDIKTAPYEQGIPQRKDDPDGKAVWKGMAVTFAFKKAPPLGMFSATALVRTDHPDYARISIPITANVTGKVWVQTRTIYFGWVPKGKLKRTTLLVKPFSEDVDLGTVTATSRNGKVNVEVDKHPMNRTGWWRLLVEVPADAAEGRLDDVVVVRTAVPGEEETEIQVQGEVLEVGR